MRQSAAILSALLLAVAARQPAWADEGMWTVNGFPADRVEKAYGFKPDQAWLDHVRLSSLRLARGCSASFVSPYGLVQTNHHCARACIEQLSTATRDLIATGFYANEARDELKCPDVEANQLIAITDVTDRINRATASKDGQALTEAKKAIEATIARECSGNDANIRCDVVELYRGGVYNLYKYRRYQDVRLVFAPEMAIAFFGGDPDNFEFPRYDLDVSYLRVYLDGAPLDTNSTYLRYAKTDAQAGDLTFTSGHPGSTNRLDTVADLEFRRDVTLPRDLFYQSEMRGMLTEFSTKGTEQARIAKGLLFGVENALKARKGQYAFTEDGQGFRSRLFNAAKTLVRHAAEAKKPDEARLKEFTSANFPILRQSITSTAPIYPELERLTLTFSLTKLREALGPDDVIVKKVLGRKSPAELASELVDGSSLANVELRRRLLDAEEAVIEASTDPMIVFVRSIDPDLRAVRKQYEDDVQAPLAKYSGQIANAMFKIYGTSNYPDATFTLRISYGTVKGYRENGRDVEPITTLAGAFERATGADPFKLPDSWIAARPTLDLARPFNFVTTNDIIGGNSGSPVINKAGEVVGLIFDGNIQSLGGAFGYDPAANRAVAVALGALRETLSKVYHADRIVDELKK